MTIEASPGGNPALTIIHPRLKDRILFENYRRTIRQHQDSGEFRDRQRAAGAYEAWREENAQAQGLEIYTSLRQYAAALHSMMDFPTYAAPTGGGVGNGFSHE